MTQKAPPQKPTTASTSTSTSTTAAPDELAARLGELQNLVQLATLHGVDVSDDVVKERDAVAAALAARG